MVYIPVLIVNAISIVLAGIGIVVTYRRRGSQGADELFVVSCFIAFWSTCSLIEMLSPTFAMKLLWRNITQIGAFLAPVSILNFCLAYTDRLRSTRRYLVGVSYSVQSISVLLIFSDGYHHLVRSSITVSPTTQMTIVESTSLGSLLIFCNYVLLFVSIVLLLTAIPTSHAQSRKQIVMVLFSMSVSIIFAATRQISDSDVIKAIPTSVAFSVSAMAMLLGITRYDFLRLAPLAYEQTFRSIGDALVVCSPEGRIVDANPAAKLLLGPNLQEVLSQMLADHEEKEVFHLKQDGKVLLVNRIALSDKRGDQAGTLVVIKDITLLEEQRALLTERAERDGLTGLYNRSTFIELVEAELKSATKPVHLLFIDIDHFKLVNDTFGHRAGDYVLIELSKLINCTIDQKPGTIISRIGGEEFALFCSNIEWEQALECSQMIRSTVEQYPFVYEGNELKLTISLGLVSMTARSYDELYRQADRLLYQAKEEGRNRLCASQARQ